MRVSSPAFVLISTLALAPSLGAQYSEPSAAELFEKKLGAASELFGWAVAPLGDVNHDGFVDLAVSSPFASQGFSSSIGRVTAVSGADGSTLWSRNGTRTSAILGYSLETMDWNGDAVLDAVAGAPFADQGTTWIFSGVDGSTLAQLVGAAQGDGFGASVATGGDYDGDGVQDLLVAAPNADTPAGVDSGRVYVFARGATAPWTSLRGPYAGAEFGVGLAFAGSTTLPLDPSVEIVAGCRDAGSFFDGFASVHQWNGTQSVRRYVVGGVGMGFSLMGDRIDGGADVNGDRLHDFLVGDMNASEVEVFSGADGALLHTLDGAGEPGDFAAARFVPDMDGDGLAEIVVGAWQSNAGGQDSGRVYVCSGASGAVLRTITPTTVQLNFGIDARSCDDVDGDGRFDLAIGAYGDGFSGTLPGGAFVLSGHLSAPQNVVHAAERPTDPLLSDVGGDPSAGPITNSALEPFDLSLDCGGAPANGPFSIRVRRTTLAAPVQTPFGRRWIDGQLFYEVNGLHQRDLVSFPAVVLPPDFGLWGLSFGVQGRCGQRLSNGLTQTIGR